MFNQQYFLLITEMQKHYYMYFCVFKQHIWVFLRWDESNFHHIAILFSLGKKMTCVIPSPLGTQITCFPPTNFTLRQAAYVDSFCWAAVEHHPTDNGADSAPLHLHKVMCLVMGDNGILKEIPCCLCLSYSLSLYLQFFPYILLLVAVLMYIPALFWRFTATPSLSSDLSFIMEELDRCYNRAIRLAKSLTSQQDKDTAEDPHRCSALNIFKAPAITATWSLHFQLWQIQFLIIMGLVFASCL